MDKERVSQIRQVVSVPLVLHGASGLCDEDVKDCVKRGICKANFATELRVAYTGAANKLLAEKSDTFDPKKLGIVGMEAIKKIVKERILVCGCDGRGAIKQPPVLYGKLGGLSTGSRISGSFLVVIGNVGRIFS